MLIVYMELVDSLTFDYSFREMVEWYEDTKDNANLFESDNNVIAFLLTRFKSMSKSVQRNEAWMTLGKIKDTCHSL